MGGAEFCFGLSFEHGFLNADAESAYQSLADILGGELLLVVEFFDNTGIAFAESALMGAALGGVLSVDKTVVVVAVLSVDVGECSLEVVVLDVDDGVKGLALHVVFQQVEEAVFRVVAAVVVVERESAVEVTVVPDAAFHIFVDEMVIAEEFTVRDEFHQSAGGFECVLRGVVDQSTVGNEFAFAELGVAGLPVAERLDAEPTGEGVYGLGADTVQTYGFLEYLAVVLCAGVEFAHCVNHLAKGDAASIVADADFAFGKVDGHLDAAAKTRGELIDGVVDYLFNEDVDAVVVGGAVAQFADVHTGAETDMLHVFEVDDAVVGVIGGIAQW